LLTLTAERSSLNLNSPIEWTNNSMSSQNRSSCALAAIGRRHGESTLKSYHLLPSVRGDLLYKLGRYKEAQAEFEAAAALAGNKREQELLRRRAATAISL